MSAVRGYQNWYIDNFRCGLFVPPSYDNSKKYPLIIYLHGYTDTTTWNLQWYNEPIVSDDPCIVLTPKCPKEEIYGWGDSFDPRTSPMMSKTYQMMDMVKKSFNLDQDRYYVFGTSMGGYGTYGVIQKNPDMFAAGYAECGAANIAIAPIIASLPFWIFHGSDDPVVPVQPDRDLYKAVLDYGGTQIRYTEYPGVAFTVDLLPDNKVHLQWNLPSGSDIAPDNKVWYCRIYRNNVAITEVYNDKNSYIDITANGPADFEYKITAVNYYFKESVPSQSITITLE